MEDQRILSADEKAADLERHVRMIAHEFREGFEAVDRIDRPAVTIFGSARIRTDDPVCDQARETARLFAERGWACLLYTSPSPRDLSTSRMPSSA